MEAYRSGHNGPHSKCGYRLKRYVGSNPTASAKSTQFEPKRLKLSAFYIFREVFQCIQREF